MKNRFQNLPFRFQLAALHLGDLIKNQLVELMVWPRWGLHKFANPVVTHRLKGAWWFQAFALSNATCTATPRRLFVPITEDQPDAASTLLANVNGRAGTTFQHVILHHFILQHVILHPKHIQFFTASTPGIC
jgi:hypothetical protein